MKKKLVNEKEFVLVDPQSFILGGSWCFQTRQVWDQPIIQKTYEIIRKDIDNIQSQKQEYKYQYMFMDIGSNTGSFALLSKYFTNNEIGIHAFEPNPNVFSTLAKNVQLNQLQNKTSCHALALSNSKSISKLYIPSTKVRHQSGLATLGENVQRFSKSQAQHTMVVCTTIDDFVEKYNIQRIDFIKIDTEGWEYNILRGGIKSINKWKPKLLLEFDERNMKQCNVVSQELYDFIKNTLGYKHIENISKEDILCLP